MVYQKILLLLYFYIGLLKEKLLFLIKKEVWILDSFDIPMFFQEKQYCKKMIIIFQNYYQMRYLVHFFEIILRLS